MLSELANAAGRQDGILFEAPVSTNELAFILGQFVDEIGFGLGLSYCFREIKLFKAMW